MDYANGNIAAVAAKLIATIAAAVAAVTIAAFVGHISNSVTDNVIGPYLLDGRAHLFLYRPLILDEPRLDVICALLIPLGMALWWRRPSPASTRIVACCLGIAAGFVPVVAQVISWPFIYHSPEAVRAVAAVALLTTVSTSIGVTRRALKAGSHDASRSPTEFDHIRRHLFTIYFILLVPWVIWFGWSRGSPSPKSRALGFPTQLAKGVWVPSEGQLLAPRGGGGFLSATF